MRLLFIFVLGWLTLNQTNSQYTKEDSSGCVFPFTFNGQKFTECTNAGSKYSWCSFNKDFLGVWKYCNDQKVSDWKCTDECVSYRGDEYPSCQSDQRRQRLYCTDKISYLSTSDNVALGVCPEEYKAIPYHTRCLASSKYVVAEGVNEADKKEIVDLHDAWRSDLEAPASAMLKMRWSDELAEIAQRHASRCDFDHDQAQQRVIPGTGKYSGQNIVMSIGETNDNLTQQFDKMYTVEKPRWGYGVGILPKYVRYRKTAGHYTQLLLDHVDKIGCGQATCVYADRKETLFVCNYNAMQYEHEMLQPYKQGEWCSDCKDKCVNGKLCDCGGKECFNGGELDTNTCTCTCKGFWKGDSCQTEIVPVKQANGCMYPYVWANVMHSDCMADPDAYYDYPICSSAAIMTYSTIIECKA